MAKKKTKKLHHPVKHLKAKAEDDKHLEIKEYADNSFDIHVSYNAEDSDIEPLKEIAEKVDKVEISLEQARDLLKEAGYKTKLHYYNETEIADYYEFHPRRKARYHTTCVSEGKPNPEKLAEFAVK